jgi:hypothetical protein
MPAAMPTTSMRRIPVKAQTMTQTGSPQSNASVRYHVGAILIGIVVRKIVLAG